MKHITACTLAICGSALMAAGVTLGQDQKKKPDFPPFEKVSEGYAKVTSTADGRGSLYTVYRNNKKQQLLAELPRNFDGQKIFIATSVAGGSSFTGWQWMDMYVYWTRVGTKLVLMEPELQYQSKGSQQLGASVKRTYTDRVVLSVPIVSMGQGGGPVIDLDNLLIGQSGRFGMPMNPGLSKIDKCKAFPSNLEIAFEGPGSDGRLTTLHYSISSLPKSDYQPREADERIGYFMTVYKDFNQSSDDGKQFVRYVNRWNLKKRDPKLKLSPPEQPIIFYLEHTIPVQYRRYVRDGILEWNNAYEQVGIDGAIEVRQQDAKTKAFMDYDPEDVRYNFFRWITSERAFAMGPSRVNPTTGQILDADIIFDDSMARYYALDYQRLIAELPTEDADEESLAWLAQNPRWDPRNHMSSLSPNAGSHVAHNGSPNMSAEERALFKQQNGDNQTTSFSEISQVVQQNRECNYAVGMAHQLNMARLAFDPATLAGYDEDTLIDGLPEEFIGQVIKEIVMHEVGHTLGLRHNFKASTWKTLDEMNDGVGEPMVGSVMDYNPINIAPEGTEQGDFMTTTLGPYDLWAIEYGYTQDKSKLADITARVAEPSLVYATDEDASGPDPLVRRFDMAKDPIAYAKRQIDQANQLRSNLLDRAVQDGDAWYRARSFYSQLMYQQAGAVNDVTRFIGGTYVNRDRKGDPNARPPLTPVEAAKQREALSFVIDNTFPDSAYDMDPELLQYLSTDKFNHWGNSAGSPELPIHSMVMNIQRGTLFGLMSPTKLRRVYDNELLTPADQDALTLPELMDAVTNAVWSEINGKSKSSAKYSNRQPMISSLRRNLQREYLANLIDLSSQNGFSSTPRAVQSLALESMHELQSDIDNALTNQKLDDYTRSHLKECSTRLDNAINAVVSYSGN